MDLIDLIYNTAKNQDVGYEEVIEEEVYGYSLRQEILREIKWWIVCPTLFCFYLCCRFLINIPSKAKPVTFGEVAQLVRALDS